MNTSPHLRDCHASGKDAELFVVEGKSAADALERVRSRKHQAVFALQGKIPNPQRHGAEKILANDHCRALFETIGCGIGDNCKPETSRFGKVLLLCDSDIDGLHSRSLLISLCCLYLQPMVRNKQISLIRAPCYRLPTEPGPALADANAMTQAGAGKARSYPPNSYLYGEAEKQRWLARRTAGSTEGLTHFKGIATMDSSEIASLLLDKNTRTESSLTNLPTESHPAAQQTAPRQSSR